MKFHNIEQNSEEWSSLRLGKVTSSHLACIMANGEGAFGEPAKRYALQLALERITEKKAEYSFSNADMERGHEQEPIARQLYEEEYFCRVDNGGFFDCGLYGDSPDGLIGTQGIAEIKSVIASVHYANIVRGSFDPSYRWQLIGHIDCSERDWCDFISYCSDFPDGNQLFVSRLNRKDFSEDIKRMQSRRSKFLEYVEVVENNIRSMK